MKRPLDLRLREMSHREPSGCLLWDGAITYSGYGRISVNGVPVGVHRAAYTEWVGPIPEGLEIDHLCGVRSCIEPTHLEAVTRRENVIRSNGPSAVNARKAKCNQGHKFTPENTYIRPRGQRQCRTCADIRRRAYKEARR